MDARRTDYRPLEGRRVCIALVDGSRIDDCELVSVRRTRTGSLWIYSNGEDLFVPAASVADVWEAAA